MASTARLLGHVLLGVVCLSSFGQPQTAKAPRKVAQQTAGVATADTSIAFVRAARLHRGINLSMWYAQAGDYSDARLASFTTAEDFALIKRLGFDHVRLSIDPEPLIREAQSGELKPEAMVRLDKTVEGIVAAGLAVVLDIHPEEPYKRRLAEGNDDVWRFCAFWRAFAGHYAGTDPDKVYFEVMNEPAFNDLYRWAGVQARAVAAIRGVTARHTVIATAGSYAKVDELLAMEPLHDDNVIYTFHEYDPMWFTHQGANWGVQGWVFLRGVPYPSSPEAVAGNLAQEQDDRVRLYVQRYGAERWDGARMRMEIDAAADWAEKRHVPLWCGEFGVYREYANPKMRAAWIKDVRTALEARHVGWAMWDYQGSFGTVLKDGKTTLVDPLVPGALGLEEK
jgi:aryl-phospho-beta-D-glucosidase BglC (GH1 family)